MGLGWMTSCNFAKGLSGLPNDISKRRYVYPGPVIDDALTVHIIWGSYEGDCVTVVEGCVPHRSSDSRVYQRIRVTASN